MKAVAVYLCKCWSARQTITGPVAAYFLILDESVQVETSRTVLLV